MLGKTLSADLAETCISFDEVGQSQGLESKGANAGLSLVDYDQDGRIDVFVLKKDQPNVLFQNLGSGFKKTALNVGNGGYHAAWRDIDQDGRLDFVLTGKQGTKTCLATGSGFLEAPAGKGIQDSNPGNTALWVGANLLLSTDNGTRYFLHQGQGKYVENTAAAGLKDPGDGAAIAMGHYDQDTKEDIYLANSTGENRLFRNLGNGTYESLNDLQVIGNNTDAAWIPFNGFALPSLFVSTFGGGNRFFVRQANGDLVEQAAQLGVRAPGNTTRIAAADALKVGQPAIFLGRFQQPNLFFLPKLDANHKTNGFVEAAHILGMDQSGATVGAQWADFDKDGRLDLLVAMADGGLLLFQNKTAVVCE